MLQLANHSLLQCTLGVFANPDGVECAYGTVKATFEMIGNDRVALAAEQIPFVAADNYWGDPSKTSVKSAGELTLIKASTDIVMSGHAYAPRGRANVCDVSLCVGPVSKAVRVFGDRTWERGALGFGFRPSAPAKFDRLPLKYEFAFGGTDPQPTNEQKVDYEPRNPVGQGLVPLRSKLKTLGLPLPNIEDPRQMISSTSDRPAPAGFGPICPHWSPRKALAGTYDEQWEKKRSPYLPLDFDPRFLQCAPPDLIAPKYLSGGESVDIINASPRGRLQFALPLCTLLLTFHLDGKPYAHVPNLDTVIFEPDDSRFHMIWRASQIVDKKLLRLSKLELECNEFAKRKAA